MTPEERFERIEKALDRMIVTTALLDRAEARHEKWMADYEERLREHEERFARIDLAMEFIIKSQASFSEAVRRLADALDSHRKDPNGHGGEEEEEES
jgi:hypothetical protein